jgi:hypothetical protein
MSKRNKKSNNEDDKLNNTWVLSTKREGDRIGNWVIEKLFDQNARYTETGERCKVTACCYPSGARLVRARLARIEPQQEQQSLAG